MPIIRVIVGLVRLQEQSTHAVPVEDLLDHHLPPMRPLMLMPKEVTMGRSGVAQMFVTDRAAL